MMVEDLNMSAGHEEGLLQFLVPETRDRARALLRSSRRRKWTAGLAHVDKFDQRWIASLPSTDDEPAILEGLLRAQGAPKTCWIVSENRDWDARQMPLREALEATVGAGWGTLLSCIPGRLAFFEGEGPKDRYILSRDR